MDFVLNKICNKFQNILKTLDVHKQKIQLFNKTIQSPKMSFWVYQWNIKELNSSVTYLFWSIA
jgi:hypothetical protein